MRRALLTALMGAFVWTSHAVEAPPLKECIAPSDPGGGWDFTCRSVGKILHDENYVTQNIQTVNMAGAGGGVAFAHVVSKRSDDASLFVAASTATTTRLAQNQFPGVNADMVRWAGALGADYGIIAVNKDSAFNNLNELLDSIKQDSGSVKFAGASSAGGWDHLKVLMVAKDGGIENFKEIRYLSFNNGGDAITQVVGGHVDAFTGDISEVKGFLQSGDIKVLAVLSEERLPEPYQDILTATEQGVATLAPNWRGFYLPGNVSDEHYQWWTDTLDSISSSEVWQDVMQQNGLMPFHKSGAEFDEYVQQQIQDIQTLSKELGIM